jgi:hypothetical protein
MKKIVAVIVLLFGFYLQPTAFVTTLINKTGVNIKAQLHFSDSSIENKGIGIAQSYQVVNFDTKKLESASFTSNDKDKNGNLYTQLDQKFVAPTGHVSYEILLQDVGSHKVPAGRGTESCMMPATQKIICHLAGSGDQNS